MRARPRGMPLALAITLALIVKIIILTMLHKAFFSAPQAKKMRMPTEKVEQHLLGRPAASLRAPSSTQPAPKAQP